MIAMLTRAAPWSLIAAVALAGLQTYRIALEQAAHASTLHRHTEQLRAQERAAREAVADARAEERRRYLTLQEIAENAKTEIDRARADAAGAADAAVRLRQRIATIAAARCPAAGDTAASSGSEAAGTATDLLADMQRRLDEAAGEIAEHADAAGIAGSACARAYDALTLPDQGDADSGS